jgi:hypothetical protein
MTTTIPFSRLTFVIARSDSDEAIQNNLAAQQPPLDCFAALAMTRTTPFSRRVFCSRPSFVARHEERPPEHIKGRRSAERRIQPMCPLCAGKRSRLACVSRRAPHRARTPSGAPPRRSPGFDTWLSSRPALHGIAMCDHPIPGQRAPRGPVVVPAGRVPGAARVRDYEPRPRAPRLLRFRDRLEKRPSIR